MSNHLTQDQPVIVGMSGHSASLDAVWWAAAYARRRRAPLRIVHTGSDGWQPVLDQVRARYPKLTMSQELAAAPITGRLADASEAAHVIVVGHHYPGPLARPAATRLAARAQCPVIAVPGGGRWSSLARPVVIGVAGERSARQLAFGFAEASRLSVGVRVVRCTLRQRPGDAEARAIHQLTASLTARYPEVPVTMQLVHRNPVSALSWHSRFGSMVIVGARGGPCARSVGRAILRRRPGPIVLIGAGVLDSDPQYRVDSAYDNAPG